MWRYSDGVADDSRGACVRDGCGSFEDGVSELRVDVTWRRATPIQLRPGSLRSPDLRILPHPAFAEALAGRKGRRVLYEELELAHERRRRRLAFGDRHDLALDEVGQPSPRTDPWSNGNLQSSLA